MISERQAETLLLECEKAMGHPLAKLRQRIANQEKTYSNLWELIVLHSALPLGSVEHEQEEESRPDVRVVVSRNKAFWIEATYIYSRTRPHMDDATDFSKWVLCKLEAGGISHIRNTDVAVFATDASKAFETPRRNEWSQLLQSTSWRQFLENARDLHHVPCRWVCPSGNVTFELRGLSQGGTTLISLSPRKKSRDPTDHPVYKEIADKAEQIKRWHRSGQSYQPLVLCIGTEDTSEVNSSGSGGMPLRRAVYSAFVNARGMSLSERINITGRIDGKHFQVGGSQYISGVIIITIEPGSYLFTGPRSHPRARSILFANPQAKTPLTQEDLRLLRQLNFNSVEWGPGWEAWEARRGTKRADNTTINRVRSQWGSIIMRSLSGESFGIEIPVHVIARLLAGDISREDMETAYNRDFVSRLKLALEQGQDIVGCEYVRAKGKSRDYDRILLRYGPPRPPVISDPNKQGGGVVGKKAELGRSAFRWLSGLCDYLRGRSSG